MLADIERKVLRIIANFDAMRRRPPTIDELCIKTGRDPAGIMQVLEVLNREEYIKWDRRWPERMELLEAWEREERFKRVY
ncbi:hypothetical protein ACTID9_01175 [Brevibacillus fluminis]|uniref:hypothetical protein n=1 Tax=Brevibacillus fluminis TaxID=511487 RepID=UPI003F8C0276